MALGRAPTSAKAADIAKLLLLNECHKYSHVEHNGAPHLTVTINSPLTLPNANKMVSFVAHVPPFHRFFLKIDWLVFA